MSYKVYSKHKDCSPEETVRKIQGILNDAGLFPITEWCRNLIYPGVCSNRVTLFPSRLGTNGKGTNELYAAASGHAELIERMENGILPSGMGLRQVLEKVHGFSWAPDEKYVPSAKFIEGNDRFTKYVLEGMGLLDKEVWMRCFHCIGTKDNTISVVPFADPKEGDVKWLLAPLVLAICGSNGMAAGNTMEEAMVQALSEIFERYVSFKLIAGEATPPIIPDEVLQEYGFWPLIEAIRSDGDYEVSIYDCTLGKCFPVAGCIIVNKNTGTFGLKLGSHPSFAVAVERTLTEAMQGRLSIESFSKLNHAASLKEATNFHNPTNVNKVGIGVYNASLFHKKPDWEFAPWKEWEGLDNRGFLKKMLSLLEQENFAPLVRDVSFLGFPACYIVVPGMSQMYPPESLTLRQINTIRKLYEAHRHFPHLTAEEEDALLKMIRFKENSVNENQLGSLLGLPVYGNRMNSEIVGGFLAYKRGDFVLASHFFGRRLRITEDEVERQLITARLNYLGYLQKGFTREESAQLIRRFFREEVAERVVEEMAEPETVMERIFPKTNCPDCEHCELKGVECDDQALAVGHKIWAAMKKGRGMVSQEKMLKFLEKIMKEQ